MTQIFAADGNLVGVTVLQAARASWCSAAPRKRTATTPRKLGLVEFIKPQRVNKALDRALQESQRGARQGLREVRHRRIEG